MRMTFARAWRGLRHRAACRHAAHGARCMIFVTPDGERSMNTYLQRLRGWAGGISGLKSSRFESSEGYLWDRRAQRKRCAGAGLYMKRAGSGDGNISDAFTVDRYRDGFWS